MYWYCGRNGTNHNQWTKKKQTPQEREKGAEIREQGGVDGERAHV